MRGMRESGIRRSLILDVNNNFMLNQQNAESMREKERKTKVMGIGMLNIETLEMAKASWVNKKVRLDWHLWYTEGYGEGWKVRVPTEYHSLLEEWFKVANIYGVIQDVRPLAIKVGRCPWQFKTMLSNGQVWWLPRGAFEITSHRAKGRTGIAFIPAREKSLGEVQEKPALAAVNEEVQEIVQERITANVELKPSKIARGLSMIEEQKKEIESFEAEGNQYVKELEELRKAQENKEGI